MGLPFWLVFGVLLVSQWSVVAVVSRIAMHNGWSYYSGGDDSWYYTSAWVLAHGHLPQTDVGGFFPLLLAPLALIAGPNLVAGLPYVVAFDMLVLWPIALLCVYGIAKAIGGRGYAYLVSLLWTVFPLLSIRYFYERYHERFIDLNLPTSLGLVATADFTATVTVLVAAYFTVRAIERGDIEAGLFAGLATGVAFAVKPSSLIFLPAPVAALAVGRRWRSLGGLAVGLVPAAIGLVLWKYRGLGYLPAFQSSPVALAMGAGGFPSSAIHWRRYINFDWAQLRANYFSIREYTWSLRMITWGVVAGVIALTRRSAAIATLLGIWFLAFLVLKGGKPGVNVIDSSFFRHLMASYPAFFFGLVATPLLVPILGRRLAALGRSQSAWPVSARSRRTVIAVAAVVSVVPIAAFAAEPPLKTPSAVTVPSANLYVPANTFALSATKSGGRAVVLSWPSQDAAGAKASYVVFRLAPDGILCIPQGSGSANCSFYSDAARTQLTPIGVTAATTFRDVPPAGRWTYRVAATVALQGPTQSGNYYALSRPAHVLAPG
jgi:hypothetical protein